MAAQAKAEVDALSEDAIRGEEARKHWRIASAASGFISNSLPSESDLVSIFDEKMKKLTFLLKEQQEEGAKLDKQISNHLKRIGYG